MTAKAKNLKYLLNSVEDEQKSIIVDYSRGHLNPSHLCDTDALFRQSTYWVSANRPAMPFKERSRKIEQSIKLNATIEEMKNVLYHIAVGTTVGTSPQRTVEIVKSPISDTRTKTMIVRRLKDIDDLRAYIPTPPLPPIEIKRTSSTLLYNNEAKNCLKWRDLTKIPGVLEGSTKNDQYGHKKQYSASVIREQDANKLDSFTGRDMVANIERCVDVKLKPLSREGKLSKQRLDVLRDCFSEIIDTSATFGHILSLIKVEYESYLESVTEAMHAMSYHDIVQTQVRRMTVKEKTRSDQVKEAKMTLDKMEDHAEKLLAENQRLRNEIRVEKQRLESLHDLYRTRVDGRPPEKTAVNDEIENMKKSILEKLCEIDNIRENMLKNSAFKADCEELDNTNREFEADIQKHMDHIEELGVNIGKAEARLREELLTADCSDRDERIIWKQANSLRCLESFSKVGESHSTYDEDDATKWSWYIS